MRNARAIVIGAGRVKAGVTLEKPESAFERARGFSGRARIEDGHGMWFSDTAGPFWMKDCKTALDVVFLDKTGTVLDIKHMPLPVTRELPLYASKSDKATQAVEFAPGWLAKKRIGAGDRFVFVEAE